jgi:hypothetical protein
MVRTRSLVYTQVVVIGLHGSGVIMSDRGTVIAGLKCAAAVILTDPGLADRASRAQREGLRPAASRTSITPRGDCATAPKC